jgi:hypothetical protein
MGVVVAPSVTLAQILPGGEILSQESEFLPLPSCSHTWELAPALEHRAEFPQFHNQGQSVGLLGRVISSSQDLYLYTNTEKHTHKY